MYKWFSPCVYAPLLSSSSSAFLLLTHTAPLQRCVRCSDLPASRGRAGCLPGGHMFCSSLYSFSFSYIFLPIYRSIYFSNLLFCCALILPSFILSVACLPSSCILLSLHPSSAQFFLPPLPCHCVSSFYLPSSLSLLFAGPHTLRSPTLQYLNESYFAFLAFVFGLRPAVGPMQAGTP